MAGDSDGSARPDRFALKVFISHRDSVCDECHERLGPHASITLAGERGALCLTCADLDHLAFLPSGEPALTRRAHKHTALAAVVVKWSRTEPAAQTANDELVKLALAGMGEEILLGVVAKRDKTKYDTSADALVKLKTSGVSQRVIAAILDIAPVPAADAPAVPAVDLALTPPRPRRAAAPPVPGSPLRVSEDLSLPTTAEANAATNLRFTVFISAPQRDGFFDTTKEIEDSIKDLRARLAKEKDVNLTITDDRKNADVILTVVRRGTGNQAYGQRIEFQEYYGGASLAQVPMIATSYWVSTMMQVGAYRKEFTGVQTQDQSGGSFTLGAWGKCAGQITTNIASWTRTNAVLMNHYKTAATTPR